MNCSFLLTASKLVSTLYCTVLYTVCMLHNVIFFLSLCVRRHYCIQNSALETVLFPFLDSFEINNFYISSFYIFFLPEGPGVLDCFYSTIIQSNICIVHIFVHNFTQGCHLLLRCFSGFSNGDGDR